MYQVGFKKLYTDAVLPTYARQGDAGLDLCSVGATAIMPKKWELIKTGLAIELPPNTEAQIRPRSGLALKHGITVLNSPGTIDQGYRGEIGVILINHSDVEFIVEKGMRIAQLVILPITPINVVEVDQLSDSERGDRGFGSSGTGV